MDGYIKQFNCKDLSGFRVLQPTIPASGCASANSTDFATADVVSGTSFVSVFDYTPEADEIAVVELVDDVITNQYIVSLTKGSKDFEGNNFGKRENY